MRQSKGTMLYKHGCSHCNYARDWRAVEMGREGESLANISVCFAEPTVNINFISSFSYICCATKYR